MASPLYDITVNAKLIRERSPAYKYIYTVYIRIKAYYTRNLSTKQVNTAYVTGNKIDNVLLHAASLLYDLHS